MNAKILLVLAAALCAAQAQSFLQDRLRQQIEDALSGYQGQFQQAQQQFQQWLNSTVAYHREQVRLSIQDIVDQIKAALEKAQQQGAAAVKCVQQNQQQLDQIGQAINEEAQKCVEEKIAPVIAAAEVFQKDLDEAIALGQELYQNGTRCGQDVLCWLGIFAELGPQLQGLGKKLAEDYFTLQQAGQLAAVEIRNCLQGSLEAHRPELEQVAQNIQKCIQSEVPAQTQQTAGPVTA